MGCPHRTTTVTTGKQYEKRGAKFWKVEETCNQCGKVVKKWDQRQ